MDIYSRLEELRLMEDRRRPMSPAQMIRYYGKAAAQPVVRLNRLGAILSAIAKTLRRQVHAPVTAQTARSAYRSA